MTAPRSELLQASQWGSQQIHLRSHGEVATRVLITDTGLSGLGAPGRRQEGRAGGWGWSGGLRRASQPATSLGPPPPGPVSSQQSGAPPTRTRRGRRSQRKSRDSERDRASPQHVELERTHRHTGVWELRGGPRPNECATGHGEGTSADVTEVRTSDARRPWMAQAHRGLLTCGQKRKQRKRQGWRRDCGERHGAGCDDGTALAMTAEGATSQEKQGPRELKRRGHRVSPGHSPGRLDSSLGDHAGILRSRTARR